MASTMIGRADCPECGFTGAHVKQSEKCIYRYCPECGAQHHARTDRQRDDLAKKTRPVSGGTMPTPTPTPTQAAAPKAKPQPEPTPTPTEPSATLPTATPAPKRSALFGL